MDAVASLAERLALDGLRARLFGKTAGPRRVGRYELRRRLGRGATSEVFEAFDPELDRSVAIKVLTTAGTPRRAARIAREARTQSSLSHENVVQVFDVGCAGDQLYIVMELVAGTTLRRWQTVHRATGWESVLAQYVRAARGLVAAHRAGLVHRDFKPSNVLVGDDGQVKVADFGLAVAGGPDSLTESTLDVERSHDDVRLTETGIVLGTPLFMAPEQHHGDMLDDKADQYAFCASLYQAILGELPFRRGSVARLAYDKACRRPEAPPTRVPRRIVNAILRGMSPKPRDRWPSMRALVAALEGSRRRVRAGSLIAVGLAGLCGLMCASPTSRAEGVATPDTEVAAEPDAERLAVATALLERGIQATEREELDEARELLEQAYFVAEEVRDHRLAGRAAAGIASAIARGPSAPASAERWANLATAHLDRVDDPEARAMILGTLASVHTEAGRFAAATAAALSAADLYEDTDGDESERVALSLNNAAGAALQAGQVDEGVALLQRAHSIYARTVDFDDPRRIAPLMNMGFALYQAGDYDQALGLLDQGIEILALQPEAPAAHVAKGKVNRAVVLVAQSRNEAALDDLQGARTRVVEAYGEAHPMVATIDTNLGIALRNLDRIDESQRAYARALAAHEARLGADHPITATTRLNLAVTFNDLGRFEEARARLEDARAVLAAAQGPDAELVALADAELGRAHDGLGNNATAVALLERALVVLRRSANHNWIALAELFCAEAYEHLGRRDEARALVEDALGHAETVHHADRLLQRSLFEARRRLTK